MPMLDNEPENLLEIHQKSGAGGRITLLALSIQRQYDMRKTNSNFPIFV